jgi:hypothetical protein
VQRCLASVASVSKIVELFGTTGAEQQRMTDKPLTVEFKLAIARRPEPKPVPEPGVKAARLRVNRAARRARNLALAYWIDGLVRAGEVEDLAGVARMCGVSRARVSAVVGLLGMAGAEQQRVVGVPRTGD